MSLCDGSRAVRRLALQLLKSVENLRGSHFKLVSSVRFAKGEGEGEGEGEGKGKGKGKGEGEGKGKGKGEGGATKNLNLNFHSVSSFLSTHGPSIVQRSLYRYMVTEGGADDPFAASFAVAPPPLDKVRELSNGVWQDVLPELRGVGDGNGKIVRAKGKAREGQGALGMSSRAGAEP